MSFDELRAFLAVAEHGSFAAAATAQGVARTSLRRHVDALEARAGVPLFERGLRGAVLTVAGQQLLARGRNMEHEFSTLLAAIRETGRAPTGLVRALLPVGMPPPIVAGLLAVIRTSWPGVRLALRWCEDPCVDADEETDFVLWLGGGAPRGAWQWRPLPAVPLRLLASTTYASTRGLPRELHELADHELHAWSLPGATPSLTLRDGRHHAITPAVTTANIDALHELAHHGVGLVWTPDAGLPPRPGRAPLVPVLPDVVGADVELRIAVPSALASLPRVEVLLRNFAELASRVRADVAP